MLKWILILNHACCKHIFKYEKNSNCKPELVILVQLILHKLFIKYTLLLLLFSPPFFWKFYPFLFLFRFLQIFRLSLSIWITCIFVLYIIAKRISIKTITYSLLWSIYSSFFFYLFIFIGKVNGITVILNKKTYSDKLQIVYIDRGRKSRPFLF